MTASPGAQLSESGARGHARTFGLARPGQWARSGRVRGAAVVLAGAGVLSVVALFDPATSRFFPPCVLWAVSGLLCPGCGLTRALHEILHGDLAAGLRLNPMLVVYLPVLGYVGLCNLLVAASGWRPPRIFVPARWIWLLLVLIVGFGIVRNTPL